jgi:hypothetical protein
MSRANASQLEEYFPGLRDSTFCETSPETPEYNCIAWALGRSDLWMWPDGAMSWPLLCPQEETVDAFRAAFHFYQYEPCADGEPGQGFEKIALYAQGNKPTHAAKQLANGRWSSKLGLNVDIEHALDGLEGKRYGKVVMFFRRPVHH